MKIVNNKFLSLTIATEISIMNSVACGGGRHIITFNGNNTLSDKLPTSVINSYRRPDLMN